MRKFIVVLIAVIGLLIGGMGIASSISAEGYTPNLNANVLFTSNNYTMQALTTELAESQDGLFHFEAGFATALQDSEAPDYTVLGFTMYIKNLVEKAGWNWKSVSYNPSLGVMGLADLSGNETPAVAISINAVRFEHDLGK